MDNVAPTHSSIFELVQEMGNQNGHWVLMDLSGLRGKLHKRLVLVRELAISEVKEKVLTFSHS